jgi:hypothetical protein
MYEFASCAAITVICSGIAFAIKKAEVIPDKWIPIILLVLGIALGSVAFLTGMPSYPAQDIITAIAVGVYSSMTAIGLHQVVKQGLKEDDDNEL